MPIKYINLFILLILFSTSSCQRKSAVELFNEAYALEEQQKYDDAIILLNKAIEKNPKYIEAYINRGADKSALGKYSDAIDDYKKALHIDSNNVLAIFNTGQNYLRLDSFSTAANYFTKAIKLKNAEGRVILDLTPNDFTGTGFSDVPAQEIFYARGYAFKDLELYRRAIEDFQKCIGLDYMVSDCKDQISYCIRERQSRIENDSSRFPKSQK